MPHSCSRRNWMAWAARTAIPAALGLETACNLLPLEDSDTVKQPWFILTLVDETESFRNYWNEMLGWVTTIVSRFQPQDGFGLIAVNDAGFQPENVRIPMTELSPGMLEAVIGKRKLIEAVKALERRKARRPLTDLMGSLRHAAHFLKAQAGHEPILVVFSDMKQTPRMPVPQDAAGLRFPEGTRAHFFYVDATGWTDWQRSIDTWYSVLSPTGLVFGASDFYQKGQTAQAINRIFPANR